MKVSMKVLILAALLLTFAQSSFAGGMSGGGGEIIDDMHNPWFVENTKSVTYCIKIDTSSVSADPATIEMAVDTAISDWTHIFSEYQTHHPDTPLKLATQTWVKVDCGKPVDVAFQFGWGTLSPDQIADLSEEGHPQKYIAVAWRDSYDQTQLKGRGFVYVGSDFGPYAFSRGPDPVKLPWQHSGLIYLELIHELGHVFGLPHLSSRILDVNTRWVMSEWFPEVILGNWLWKDGYPTIESQSAGDTPLFDPILFQRCSLDQSDAQTKKILDWFEAPAGTACLNFLIDIQGTKVASLTVQAADKNAKPLLDVPIPIAIDSSNVTGMADIELYLNPKQTVFAPPTYNYLPYLPGPGGHSGEVMGTYISPSGMKRPLLVIFNSDAAFKIAVTDPATGSISELIDNLSFGAERSKTTNPRAFGATK
jgi:hypothetical protein